MVRWVKGVQEGDDEGGMALGSSVYRKSTRPQSRCAPLRLMLGLSANRGWHLRKPCHCCQSAAPCRCRAATDSQMEEETLPRERLRSCIHITMLGASIFRSRFNAAFLNSFSTLEPAAYFPARARQEITPSCMSGLPLRTPKARIERVHFEHIKAGRHLHNRRCLGRGVCGVSTRCGCCGWRGRGTFQTITTT